MPKIEYKSIKFQQKSLELIRLVNQVVEEYQAQGYELTLRQAYYQLVARGYIPNNERSYKNIGNLINDGRLAGLIDWHSITDRTRNLRSNSHWDNPADVIASARYSYLLNKWDGQPNYVEVWVEKDALVDIVGQACRPLDTPYFSCRGYTSQSEMWSAAQRFISQDYRDNRVIIHLGDHDPSGIDMTRDIQERLQISEIYQKDVNNYLCIRVIDQLGNDDAVLFNTKYLGVVPNNASGRTSLWSDLVKIRTQLQELGAIEGFTDSDVTVAQGDSKKAVVITSAITVVNAMGKLYETVTVA